MKRNLYRPLLAILTIYLVLFIFLVFPSIQVLVTVPLTLLQKSMIQFNPPLPERKLKAIHSLGAGIIEKVTPPHAHPHGKLWNPHALKFFFLRLQFSFHANFGTEKSKGLTTLVTYHQVLTRGACLVFSMTWTHRCVFLNYCYPQI